MNKFKNYINTLDEFTKYFIIFSALSIYCSWGIGLFSDDFFYVLYQSHKESAMEALVPGNSFISLPFEQLTHTFFLYFCDLDSVILPVFLKTLYVIACLYMCSRFFSLFTSACGAFLIAVTFLYYPSHESTLYWYLCQYLMITISSYFYAYYSLVKGNYKTAIAFAFIASFISYGSVAPALALSCLAWKKYSFKKALILFVPNSLYILYYLVTTKIINVGIQRVPDSIGIFAIVKQYVLQVLTSIDATIGPSFFLKVYYSLCELGLVSVIVGILVLVAFLKTGKQKFMEKISMDLDLLLMLLLMVIIGFGMFAVTGRYPQLAFNLGNRVTIFTSALLAYVICLLCTRKSWLNYVFVILLFSSLGISNHWKKATNSQGESLAELAQFLEKHPEIKKLHIAGKQYSKMGSIHHIEMFSGDWVCDSMLKLMTDEKVSAMAINRNFLYKDGIYKDIRYNKTYSLEEKVHIYNLETHKYSELKPELLNDYISNLPRQKRHWVQLIENETIKGWIIKLMPRIEYAFN